MLLVCIIQVVLIGYICFVSGVYYSGYFNRLYIFFVSGMYYSGCFIRLYIVCLLYVLFRLF